MAKSTQSTLTSRRQQMVPREGMASAGWGQMGLEEKGSSSNMLSLPLPSPLLPSPPHVPERRQEPSRQGEAL